MVKKISMLLLIMAFSASLVACGAKEEAEERETTKKERTTESTTEKVVEEVTTEKETKFDPAEYPYKGTMLCVFSEDRYNFFNNFKISPGDVISVNEISDQLDDSSDHTRGWIAMILYGVLGKDGESILAEEGFDSGNGTYYIPYEKNYTIENTSADTYIFEFVGALDTGARYFDVHN